jgi:hypothetical protein
MATTDATYDPALASRLAKCCAYAQDFDGSSVLQRERRQALPAVRDNPVSLRAPGADATSYATVFRGDDEVIVAYRGTMPNLLDWAENFEADLVPAEAPPEAVGRAGGARHVFRDAGGTPARAHRGFLEELLAVQPSVLAAIGRDDAAAIRRGDRRLYVTGHSQGAVIGTIAAAAFAAAGLPPTATYAFACPRPGDAALRRVIERASPLFRVQFGNDIVPHVPPTRPPPGDPLVYVESAHATLLKHFSLPEIGRQASSLRSFATAFATSGISLVTRAFSDGPAATIERVRHDADRVARVLRHLAGAVRSCRDYEPVGVLWYGEPDVKAKGPVTDEGSLIDAWWGRVPGAGASLALHHDVDRYIETVEP